MPSFAPRHTNRQGGSGRPPVLEHELKLREDHIPISTSGRETVNEDEDDAEERPGAVPARFAYDNTENKPYARGGQDEPDEPNPPDSEPEPSNASMDEPDEPEPDETWEENHGTGLERRFEPEDYGVVESDEPEPPEDEPEDY